MKRKEAKRITEETIATLKRQIENIAARRVGGKPLLSRRQVSDIQAGMQDGAWSTYRALLAAFEPDLDSAWRKDPGDQGIQEPEPGGKTGRLIPDGLGTPES